MLKTETESKMVSGLTNRMRNGTFVQKAKLTSIRKNIKIIVKNMKSSTKLKQQNKIRQKLKLNISKFYNCLCNSFLDLLQIIRRINQIQHGRIINIIELIKSLNKLNKK